jgi:hypothetical protein
VQAVTRKSHVRAGIGLGALVALCLLLAACGGGSGSKQGATGADTSAASSGGTDPASVQSCLEAAGFELVTSGNLPIIEGSKALGVRLPGGGNLEPGHLSAALFWYATVAEATKAAKEFVTSFPAISRLDKIVVFYNPAPDPAAQTKIDNCAAGL